MVVGGRYQATTVEGGGGGGGGNACQHHYTVQCSPTLTLHLHLSSILVVLQDILKSYDDGKISELSETALRLLEEISPFDSSKTGSKSAAVQLQGMGINLWNKAVALKSASAISPQLNAQSVLTKTA